MKRTLVIATVLCALALVPPAGAARASKAAAVCPDALEGARYYRVWTWRWQDQLRVPRRSEEHTSELQSLRHLVCRLLLEKKKEINGKLSTSKAHELIPDTVKVDEGATR